MKGNNEISLCTTIKNRWKVFREVIKTWIGRDFFEIIVVDWDSTDVDVYEELSKIFKGAEKIKVVEVRDQPCYLGSTARNLGFSYLESKYVFFIDCDIKINVGDIYKYTSKDQDFYHGSIQTTGSHTTGSCIIKRDAFEIVNGYNEEIRLLPIEDRDFYRRLKKKGYREGVIDAGDIEHVEHDYYSRIKYRLWMDKVDILYKEWGKDKKRSVIEHSLKII